MTPPIGKPHRLSEEITPAPGTTGLAPREYSVVPDEEQGEMAVVLQDQPLDVWEVSRRIQDHAIDVSQLIGQHPYEAFLRSIAIYERAIERGYADVVIVDIQEMAVIQIKNVLALIIMAEDKQKAERKADVAHRKADQLKEINTVLERESKTDPLTDLLNKKGLDKEGTKIFNHCKEKGIPLSCLYMDLDFFKTVNDDHGHPVGDSVLTEFAKNISTKFREFIQTNFRQYDLTFTGDSGLTEGEIEIFARDGGEEFMVLMPFTDLEEAVVAAERFREFIQSEPINLVKINGKATHIKLDLTCTIGVSQANFDRDKSIYDLKANADDALKKGKKTHRNIVCVSSINADGETSYTFPHLKSPGRKTVEAKERYAKPPEPQAEVPPLDIEDESK